MRKSIVSEDLTVDDLPDFWNEMSSYLGIDITNDAQGACKMCTGLLACLGISSYTLGTLIANFTNDWRTHWKFGSPDSIWNMPINTWLQHVHSHGCKKTTARLLSDLGIRMSPDLFFQNYKKQF